MPDSPPSNIFSKLKRFGPGVLVSAAFIGPGTVTTSTLAGANYGYALVWALVFATFATIILQEMSARLGTVAQQGLGESLVNSLKTSPFKWPLIALLIVALFGGNAAYEGGNIAGAALGATAVFGDGVKQIAIIFISLFSATVLFFGRYQDIEKILIALVALMALAFCATFVVVAPNMGEVFAGVFSPKLPDGASVLTVVALIGTTVVPYNLFLHAAAAKTRWQGEEHLRQAQTDTIISITLGGLIAILITSTAAASLFARALAVCNAADMALQFTPLFGEFSRFLLGFGLFAAGLSSAITAPLATAFAISEIFAWQEKSGQKSQQTSAQFKAVALSILLIGSIVAITGIKPITLIVTAQFANGLLLPITAGFLLYVVNQHRLLGKHTNGMVANTLGGLVVMITTLLGIRAVLSATGVL